MVPRVSVVIPVYNLGRYLPDAVESALEQSYPSFEVIIIDDGSTDEATIEAVASYEGAGEKTRVLRTSNQGLAQARNYAIDRAGGEYVLPLDADDMIAPAFLERTVPVLDRDAAVGFVYTSVQLFGEYHAVWEAEPFEFCSLLTHNIAHSCSLIRKAAWRQVGGYDRAFRRGFEDWDFWIRLVKAGWSGAPVREVLALYRQRPNSMVVACNDPALRPQLVRQLVESNRDVYAARWEDVVIQLNHQVFCAEERLKRVYQSRLGRVASWIWALRADPVGFWRQRWSFRSGRRSVPRRG